MNKINKAIAKIEATGVGLAVRDGRLKVSNSGALTDAQKRWLREHHKAIITELQIATVHDLDRHVSEKAAAIKHWRFCLNDKTEVDIASGATLAEAHELLGLNFDDTLEALPVTEESKPLSDEEVSQLLDRAITGLHLSRAQLRTELSGDDISFETLQGYARVWASREQVPDDDRRYCHQCVNLKGSRRMASARGELKGARNQHPFDKAPRRCIAYLPGPDDPDQRPERDRWPELVKYETNEVAV